MRIVKIPNIEQYIQVVEELSPSKYTNIQNGCPYQFVIEQAIKRCSEAILLPPNSNAIIGTITHKLLEERVKGLISNEAEFKKRWKQLCKMHETRIRNDYPTLLNFIVSDYDKMFKALKIAMDMETEKPYPFDYQTASIQNAECKVIISGLLKGSIDRVKYTGNGYELIDYKTGNCFDENGRIKQVYIDQLNLYAILFKHQFKKHVSKLTIIDCDGREIDIPFASKNDDEVLEDVKQTIDYINKSVSSKQYYNLSKVSEENCNWCSCRHICKPFLASALSGNSNIYIGSIINILGDDTIQLKLTNDKIIRIMRMHTLRIKDWNSLVGRRFIFINLGKRPTESDAYFRQQNTIIFETN